MSIICGTDFSAEAQEAARAAAAMAARLRERLVLVHVLDVSSTQLVLGDLENVSLDPLRERMHAEAQRLRGSLDIEIAEELIPGVPEEGLVEYARKIDARLIVISALGRRSNSWWRLGRTADRIAQTSPIPVLVVRRAEGFEAWARGERTLRIVFGADFSATAQAAGRWLSTLSRIGPCETIVTYVYWPPEQYSRLGVRTPMDLVESQPQIEQILLRDLKAALGEQASGSDVRFRVLFSFGRPADHLVRLAESEQADLIIVGTHQRKGLRRLWHGSVSHGVLHMAGCSVACIPAPQRTQQVGEPVPDLRSVLVATDLSELSNRAVPYAYSVLPAGGMVHLVHVAEGTGAPRAEASSAAPGEEPPVSEEHELNRALLGLVPEDAARRGIVTRTSVVEGSDVAEAICQAAERAGADLICMGSHGRSGIVRALTGSVAQAVLARSRRPVLIVRPLQED
jgi:nucleotide-binding universal stress UspA family protein